MLKPLGCIAFLTYSPASLRCQWLLHNVSSSFSPLGFPLIYLYHFAFSTRCPFIFQSKLVKKLDQFKMLSVGDLQDG